MIGLELETLSKTVLLQQGDKFYCSDSTLTSGVNAEMAKGKKFLATSHLKITTEKTPILICSKGQTDFFPDVSYYFEGSAIPHLVNQRKIGDWTVYEADFL